MNLSVFASIALAGFFGYCVLCAFTSGFGKPNAIVLAILYIFWLVLIASAVLL